MNDINRYETKVKDRGSRPQNRVNLPPALPAST